jgi:hypothetical protein
MNSCITKKTLVLSLPLPTLATLLRFKLCSYSFVVAPTVKAFYTQNCVLVVDRLPYAFLGNNLQSHPQFCSMVIIPSVTRDICSLQCCLSSRWLFIHQQDIWESQNVTPVSVGNWIPTMWDMVAPPLKIKMRMRWMGCASGTAGTYVQNTNMKTWRKEATQKT